jgi:hypothetical protein
MNSENQPASLHGPWWLGILAVFFTTSSAACRATEADGSADGMFH